MKTIKKLTLLCLAFAVMSCAAFAVACSGGDSSNSSSSSNPETSSSSGEEDLGYQDTYPQTCADGAACAFGEWELVQDPTCTQKGVKARYCVNDETHVDYETFGARGHNYGNTGVCITCQTEFSLPTPNANAKYYNPNNPEDKIQGKGEDFDRYLLYVEEYYEIEIGSQNVWFEFPVDEPGQYAVISTSNTNGVEINRYDASAHYISPTPYPGRVLNGGNFISTVLCAEHIWSRSWTATFCLEGSDGDIVRFYITKIADAAWTPSYVTINMETKETADIADNGAEGTLPTEVPYDSPYFFDETLGFYRMGSENNPGEIIYAAISTSATRLMGEMSFTGLPEAGASLNLDGGTDVEGNYVIYNYAPFIYNDPLHGGSNTGYAAFVNQDGLHPVTKELYEFLKHYASENPPSISPEAEQKAHAWLAPCYYYTQLQAGSAEYPLTITEVGSFQAVPYEIGLEVYYTFLPTSLEGVNSRSYTISVPTDGVRLRIGGKTYMNLNGEIAIDNIAFTIDPIKGITFDFLRRGSSVEPIEVTITPLEGSSDHPLTLSLGENTLTPIELLSTSGLSNFEVYYAYTATETGSLTLSTASTAQILFGENVLTDGSVSVEVTAGDTVILYVSATSVEPILVTLTANV